MDIFIIREGRQTGPFSEDAVRAFLTEGTARPAEMGWRKGMAEWRPLNEVLKAQPWQAGDAAPPPAGADATEEERVPATAKQKAFLKYLGAEFGENLTKARAALAVSDALETPKLQARIRKWQDDKLRMHADMFQDEIDFRKANRTARYLDRVQTEGADVLRDVTKAHVQVIVESLDKRHPGWESEPESALWDHLLPAIGEHFPPLVQPAHKGSLKHAGGSKIATAATRGMAGPGGIAMPPPPTGTFGAMIRGVAFGVIALGAIIVGQQYWQQSHGQGSAQAAAKPAPAVVPEKKDAASATDAAGDPVPKAADAQSPAPEPAPGLAVPNEPSAPSPAMNAVDPAAPATPALPAMNSEKPAPIGEKPAPPTPAENPAINTPPAPASTPRAVLKLTQGIGVMLSNGQVTLPAGTILRYVATEGANVRVSWNSNVFFVPAMATDVNEPVPASSEPAATPPAPGAQPTVPATPVGSASAKPKKPADDL